MPSRAYRPKGTRVSLTIPPDLESRLTKSPKVAAEMARVVRDINTRAQATVPVGETGNLRDSFVSDVVITPDGVLGLLGYTAFYAHIVHNGSVHITANPWLLNAALSVLVTQRKAA